MPKDSSDLTVALIQPWLTNYSLPVYLELADYCHVELFFSKSPSGSAFEDDQRPVHSRIRYFEAPTLRPFGEIVGQHQSGIAEFLHANHPDVVISSANIRYFSFWISLICCRSLNIAVYAHGHGLYRKINPSLFQRMIYKFMLRICDGYICYAPIVKESLEKIGIDPRKLVVIDNTLKNDFAVRPEEKTGQERGILFVGRLRESSNLEYLIEAIQQLNEIGEKSVMLHVVGGGAREKELKSKFADLDWIFWHGSVYDQASIAEISRRCFMGCYPGDAGLSIVHYMSLSLVPLCHGDIPRHQGPEPSYIHNGQNGYFFDRQNPTPSLRAAIRLILSDKNKMMLVQKNAFETYERLGQPSFARKIFDLVTATAR